MQFEVGSIVEGKVTGITKFGAFVDIGEGKTGMVHISEVAPTYVKEITDHITDGQQVKVKILSIGDDGRISLSIKRAMEPSQNTKFNTSQAQRDNNNNNRRGGGAPRPRGGFSQGGGRQGGFGGGRRGESSEPMGFEEMLSKFKQTSEDKMSDLKKSNDVKRSPRRGAYK